MKIAVYCGSSIGNNKIYEDEVKALGKYFAQNNIDIVYGGGKVGLMGVIADSVLQNGGKVYGVIPEKLKDKELAHTQLTQLHVVDTMRERKAKMIELADCFVALPGGVGTLEEIFEVWTLSQLGFEKKACAFFNINGFYDKLIDSLYQISSDGFLKQEYVDALIKTANKEQLLESLKNYQFPKEKWS